MTTPYTYTYLPTGSIRLLHILSVAPTIRIRFEATPLDSTTPPYTALSYQWGDDSPFAQVIVEPEGGHVAIAKNLHTFLSHLAGTAYIGRDTDHRIWIDALCINQLDTEEKSRQVKRMAEVYECAAKVMLWLGPAARNDDDGDDNDGIDSDVAMAGIARYGKALVEAGLLGLGKEVIAAWPDVGDDAARVRTRDAVQALMVTAREAEGDDARAAERFPRVGFAALTQRGYFNRVWVKQEVTLARDAVVVCGSSQTDAEAFHAAALFYGLLIMWETIEWRAGRHTRIPGPFSEARLMAEPGGPFKLIQKTIANDAVGAFFAGRRTYQRGDGRLSLHELLYMSYVTGGGLGLQCKDPRDKVYGLLGMASDASELAIDTDYTKPPDVAFEHVARFLIATKGHLDILKWCRSRRAQAPTWVPDFNGNISYTWSDDMGGVSLFNATGSTTQPTDTRLNSHGSRPASIRLRGLCLDTITAAGIVLVNADARSTCDQAAVRQMFNEIEAFLKRPSIYPETEWADALWRIPICDREYRATSGYYQRATADRSGKQFTALRTQPLEGDLVGETFSYQVMMQYKDGARPVFSDKGYVGLGPRETEPGDVIVLLYGATAPFILRSAGIAGEYHLVGEAYVYGVMDGEMMDRGLDEVVFELW